MRVLAALSGGVDSSMAAALMVAEGHQVIGVTLKLWQGPNGEAPTAGCCTVSDAEDARRVAAQLDIPYYVFDYTDHFRSGVVAVFLSEYLNGRTPNPCVECNRRVKFSRLMDHAAQLGCDLLVTGHYARTVHDGEGWHLLRSADRAKDQSYVLHMLGQSELARVRFPVGGFTKAETRRLAGQLGLRTAAKPESQDICFVGRRHYRDFLRGHVADRPGKLIDTEGRMLGDHPGVAGFTVGQRRGLGVAVGEPRFVVELRPATSTVVLGRRADLAVNGASVSGVTWVAGRPPESCLVEVQHRAHGRAVPALVEAADGRAAVAFLDPQEAVAPGQAAVFYRNDELLGGGTIATTER